MVKPVIVVVFDLDETLGSFVQLGVLKDIIETYEDHELSQEEFDRLIDLHPEFVRPGILDLLTFLVKQRKKGNCDAIMIYTNNQGHRSWAESISTYFSNKVGTNVFDHIIAAFMVGGKVVEPGRTSHEKSFRDFIRCTRLPPSTQVCFIDDVDHKSMENKNVYYVNVKPYHYRLPISECISRVYPNSSVKQLDCIGIAQRMFSGNILRGDSKLKEEQEVDEVISKYMYQHIHDFLAAHNRKHHGTRKRHSHRSRTHRNQSRSIHSSHNKHHSNEA